MIYDYTFHQSCDVCDQKPVLKKVGLCSVCTWGEAASFWDWLDDGVTLKEQKAAEKHILGLLHDLELVEDDGTIDPIKARIMHIDQEVLDKVEEVMV